MLASSSIRSDFTTSSVIHVRIWLSYVAALHPSWQALQLFAQREAAMPNIASPHTEGYRQKYSQLTIEPLSAILIAITQHHHLTIIVWVDSSEHLMAPKKSKGWPGNVSTSTHISSRVRSSSYKLEHLLRQRWTFNHRQDATQAHVTGYQKPMTSA